MIDSLSKICREKVPDLKELIDGLLSDLRIPLRPPDLSDEGELAECPKEVPKLLELRESILPGIQRVLPLVKSLMELRIDRSSKLLVRMVVNSCPSVLDLKARDVHRRRDCP